MPIYEYLCKKCRKRFTLVMSVSEYEKKKIKCPKCQSTRVEQEVHTFFAVTSKKS
jgi:putative FmdB family regulatory protein